MKMCSSLILLFRQDNVNTTKPYLDTFCGYSVTAKGSGLQQEEKICGPDGVIVAYGNSSQ